MTRHSLISLTLVAAWLAAFPGESGAQQRPSAQVIFELAHPDYRDEFLDSQIESIETRVAQVLAAFLDQKIGFIDFSSDAGPAYTLRVRLDAQDPDSGLTVSDVGLHFELAGPGITETTHSYWLFRKKGLGEPIPEADPLVAEVGLLLTTEVADTHRLVREVLNLVKIADACELKLDPPEGWILPFSSEELCIDRGTQLRIKHRVLAGSVDRDVTLDIVASGDIRIQDDPPLSHIFCEVATAEGEARRQELLTGSVVTEGIYVLEYDQPDEGCSLGPESPSTVTFGGGSP